MVILLLVTYQTLDLVNLRNIKINHKDKDNNSSNNNKFKDKQIKIE